MSYNIDTWKTKECTDLKILRTALYDLNADLTRGRWNLKPPVVNIDDGSFVINSEPLHMSGFMKPNDPYFYVSEINLSNEGSGTFYHNILLPALKQSTGRLIATLVWEGGDSITKITAINGVILEEKIEL